MCTGRGARIEQEEQEGVHQLGHQKRKYRWAIGSSCCRVRFDQLTVDAHGEGLAVDLDPLAAHSFSGRSALLRRRTCSSSRRADARTVPAIPEALILERRSVRRSAGRDARGANRTRRTSGGGAEAGASGSRRSRPPWWPRRSRRTFSTSMRPHAEERRLPEHKVGELARLDGTDLVVETRASLLGVIVYFAT